MRSFILGVLTAFLIAALSSLVLDLFQKGSDVANTTSGARVDFTKDGIAGGHGVH